MQEGKDRHTPVDNNVSNQVSFRSWLNFNWDGITWQGRFEDSFNLFWNNFFMVGLSFEQMMKRYSYAKTQVKIGPLYAWISWLQEKHICYYFIFGDKNLFALAKESKISISKMALILRNFFIESFPENEDYFNEKFQVGNVINANLYLAYSEVKKDLNLKDEFKGANDEEIMTSLEVTLYDEWHRFVAKISKEFNSKKRSFHKLREKSYLYRYMKFFRDVVVLFLIGTGLVYSVKFVNQWYEDYLAKEITTLTPDFLAKKSTLTFREDKREEKKEKEKEEVKKILELENNQLLGSEEVENEERFETESDVVLSSLNTLPQDFQGADFERSEYEELFKGGYKEDKFGRNKVYRVLLKSVRPRELSLEINKLLEKYGVDQVSLVKPGTEIPGGIYYNLYVPEQWLKEFLAEITEIKTSILYVSKINKSTPKGKAKVFIWIKEI